MEKIEDIWEEVFFRVPTDSPDWKVIVLVQALTDLEWVRITKAFYYNSSFTLRYVDVINIHKSSLFHLNLPSIFLLPIFLLHKL